MSRLPRICPIDVPQHIVQRGNNRQIWFGDQQDFSVYIGWLKEFSTQFSVNMHAWVLMSNHVHLLCTPRKAFGISYMMQALGRKYVRVGMVNEPEGYGWSSFQVNGLGKISELCSPHPLYLALGKNSPERQFNYRSLFSSQVDGNLLEDIRRVSHSGMALGNDKFKDELENLTGRRLHLLPPW